ICFNKKSESTLNSDKQPLPKDEYISASIAAQRPMSLNELILLQGNNKEMSMSSDISTLGDNIEIVSSRKQVYQMNPVDKGTNLVKRIQNYLSKYNIKDVSKTKYNGDLRLNDI